MLSPALLGSAIPSNGNVWFWLCVVGAAVAVLAATIIIGTYVMHARERHVWSSNNDPGSSGD